MNFLSANYEDDDERRASAIVAPLVIKKDSVRPESSTIPEEDQPSDYPRRTPSVKSQAQISPPLTPRTSQEALATPEEVEVVFHNYLRAFYHFHPTSTVTSTTDESSITVPIDEGDVILVHSIHPNGWADGTVIASGARGWLPTNYCEPYDPASMRTLLNGLTHLWDLVRMGEVGDLAPFTKQDYVRAMIAGVRVLLEASQCLTRESHLIQTHVVLRRIRKGLLGDLSSLVKAAKRLQAILAENSSEGILPPLDEIVTKALKLVYRAVRFLDIWSQEAAISPENGFLDDVNRPPTPPKDELHPKRTSSLPSRGLDGESVVSFDAPSIISQQSSALLVDQSEDAKSESQDASRRISFITPSRTEPQKAAAGDSSVKTRNTTISHRLSYTSKTTGARNANLASEQLGGAHDSFLGFIGSFIGLHLQSRSSADFLHTTQQSVISCRKLLAVLEAVWERDGKRSDQLKEARDAMYARLTELVQAMKDLLTPVEANQDESVFLPDQGKKLVAAATSCVRSAGDCVTKTRLVIGKIGDFEFEFSDLGLAPALMTTLDGKPTQDESREGRRIAADDEKPLPQPPQEVIRPAPLLLSEATSKPLPDTPILTPLSIAPVSSDSLTADSPVTASIRSSRASMPPLVQLPIPQIPPPEPSPTDTNSPASSSNRFFGKSFRSESVNVSVADSTSTYPSSVRGDNASIISTSTRATTPDNATSSNRTAEAGLSDNLDGSPDGLSRICEDDPGVEEQLLAKTYAQELIYNKEGQISGGSLPALVEQLTTHESTPDAMFVTTFYLTFRLFTTPLDFAKSLIDRFDYVGESSEVGIPVRLRVFNVFKGWLESHWQPDPDSTALGIILTFATTKLRAALPAAGKRLAELTAKVTEIRAGSLVPRLVSSLGKTSTSSTVYSATETTAPSPAVSKSQLNTLKSVLSGGSSCSILDFDPLELARQLTVIESRLFCAIQPEELLLSEREKRDEHKGVNLKAMSTLSTDMANLVADSILSLEEPKKRALIIKQWVKISSRCLELNNYDSLMAIICSLNSAMVFRLKRTWELVSQRTKTRLEELQSVVSVDRNYAVLRLRLQNHIAPCIPFVGIYLTDLTFNDVGNQTTRKLAVDGAGHSVSVINFDKHMRTAKIIGQLQRFQVPHRLNAVQEMQDWINGELQRVRNSEQANVQNYYRRSLLLEPRAERPPKFHPIDAASVVSSLNRENSKEKFDFLSTFHFTAAKKEAATTS